MRTAGLALLLLACGTVKDTTDLSGWRTFSTTVHADIAFNAAEQDWISSAARTWGDASEGNVSIDVVFDLDFDSIESIRQAQAVTLLRVPHTNGIISQLDRRTGFYTLGVMNPKRDGTVDLRLVYDRLDEKNFQSVATHEFGHLIGLPDLATYGDVMSATSVKGSLPPVNLTETDLRTCRAYRYCRAY